jgi:AraC-like DNA-binding protein
LTRRAKNMTVRDRGAAEALRVAVPTIAAGYPQAMLDFAVARGADRAALLTRSGLAAQTLADQDNRIPLSAYVALIKAAIDLCGEPALALQFGEAVRMQDISIVGLICEAAETAAEVGAQLNRYARLVVDANGGGSSDVIRGSRDARGVWLEGVGDLFRDPLLVEAEFARLVWNTRAMFASQPAFQAMKFPLAVHLIHDEPAYRAEYERIFGAPLVFGSDRNALLVDERFPSLKHPPVNRYVFGVLSRRADAMLKELEASKSVSARVESLLMPILHTGEAGMDRIAGEMGLGRRTLLRKLKAEGTTFEKLLDGLRHKLALHYLSGRKVSVNETAYLVGFSDPAAFSRAFKRWTGSSPRALREAKSESGAAQAR